jgi:hypothetical protein
MIQNFNILNLLVLLEVFRVLFVFIGNNLTLTGTIWAQPDASGYGSGDNSENIGY